MKFNSWTTIIDTLLIIPRYFVYLLAIIQRSVVMIIVLFTDIIFSSIIVLSTNTVPNQSMTGVCLPGSTLFQPSQLLANKVDIIGKK